MKISLEGKSALVGGSSKGIGFGIAKQLAESGASVCLMARDEKKMKELVQSLPSNNSQEHSYLVVDFSDFDSFMEVNTLCSNCIEFKKLSILYNI